LAHKRFNMEDMKEFIIGHEIEIFWAFVFAFAFALLIEIIFKPFRRWREQIKKLKALSIFVGKSSSLKPEVLLEKRPFNPYYYERQEDTLINKSLNNKKNIIIIGSPLSGKSRAVYEALTKLSKPHNIAIPRCIDINLETFLFPKNTEIVVIDDLHKFVEHQNFEHLLRVTLDKNVVIVATCRSGMEYKKVKNKIDLETIFEHECTIELPRISNDTGEEIARRVGIRWGEVKFDRTVGSIFMRLAEMERRFNELDNIEKTILRALRSLYICGIYEEKDIFPLEWIKIATKRVGLERRDFEWTGLLENLRDKELITRVEKDKVRTEEVYLDYIVKPLVEMKILDVFNEMISTFSDVPEAQFKLGSRAYTIGTIDLEKAEYMKIAIKAYEEALKVRTLDRFPMDYAMTQNNLGNAYRTLGEVEAKAENCKKAIKAYEEALKVFTKEEFPEIYLLVKSNLRKLLDFCGSE